MKGQTASAINSPLVSEKNPKVPVKTPLAKTPSAKTPLAKTPIAKTPTAKTPLHKRPSMTSRLTDAKKKKTIITKPTPGSVTKAKERTVQATGIPRPKVKKVPDFAKLHAKQFGKMDNLDQYLGKKKDRMATLTPGKSLNKLPTSPRKKLVTEIPRFGLKKPQEKLAVSPKKKMVTELPKTNFNFGGNPTTSKKPFVFKANKPKVETPKGGNKILNNITNKAIGDKKANESQTAGYKPYTGKVKPWNAKDSLKNRQEMAKKVGGKNVKEQQMSHIKGVRMNKRMELMLQKRNIKN